MAQPVAALIVRVAADLSEIKGSVGEIDSTLGKIAATAKGLGAALAGAFTISAITNAAEKVIQYSSHLTDLSQHSGWTTSALQKVSLALEQNGVSLDSAISAADKLSSKLIGGDQSTVRALEGLHLSVTNLKTLEPDQLFLTVADAVGKIQSPTEKAYAAMTIFGKGGAELLSGLTGHLSDTTREFERLGVIIDEKTVAAADDFGDQMTVLEKLGTAFISNVLGPALPGLSALAQWFMTAANNVITFGKGLEDWVIKALLGATASFNHWLVAIGEASQKIPLLGKYIGVSADTLNVLRTNAQHADDQLKLFSTSTDHTTTAIKQAHPNLIGLGEAMDKAAKAAEEAAKKQDKFNESIKRWPNSITTLAIPSLQGLSQTFVAFGAIADGTINTIGETLAQATIKVDAFGNAIETRLIPKIGSLSDRVELTKTDVNRFAQEFDFLQQNITQNLAGAIVHAESFRDAFNNIWQSMKQTAAQILGEILNDLLHGFLKRMTKDVNDSEPEMTSSWDHLFNGGLGKVLDKATGTIGTWVKGNLATIAEVSAAIAGVAGMIANRGTGSDILSGAAAGAGIGGMIGGPVGAAVGAGIGAVAGLAEGLLLGDEEQRSVNPARDAWWNAHGGLGGVNATAMNEGGLSWEQTQALDQAVFAAHSMSDFNAATSRYRDLGLPGFATGTGGAFLDFGRGTPAMLHGRERVVTEAEARMGGGKVVIVLEGREIAEAMVPYFPDAINRYA